MESVLKRIDKRKFKYQLTKSSFRRVRNVTSFVDHFQAKSERRVNDDKGEPGLLSVGQPIGGQCLTDVIASEDRLANEEHAPVLA
jgi:hypothetical protein